ncbi:hypothetical protein ACIGXQ_20490 [Streptomyces anulatus]
MVPPEGHPADARVRPVGLVLHDGDRGVLVLAAYVWGIGFLTADRIAQAAALKAADKAIEVARSAADAADQVEAAVPAGSKPAATARTTAQTAQTSAILAVKTALNLGVNLPLQIRRYVQEVNA